MFPLVALAFLRLRDRQTLASAFLLGAVTATAFYVHSYFGFIALLELAILGLLHVLEPARAPRQRLRRLELGAVTLGTTIAALLPPLVISALDRDKVDRLIVNTSQDVDRLAASVPAYLLPWQRSPLFGDLTLSVWDPNTSGEPSLFYGYVTLVLAATAALVAWRRPERRHSPSGRRQHSFSWVSSSRCPVRSRWQSLSIPTPSYITSAAFSFIRNYARFGVLAGFGLVTLAAVALSGSAASDWGGSPRSARWLCCCSKQRPSTRSPTSMPTERPPTRPGSENSRQASWRRTQRSLRRRR